MKRPVVAVWFAGAVLAVIMTWPMMSAPGQLTRLDTHDGKFSVWNVAWVAHALLTDPTNVFNANIFYPQQGTLAYSEANLVAGVMAMPVYALTGNPILAHNVVVFLSLVLAFVLTWQLVRRLTGSPWAGVPPAAAFAFSAYVTAHMAHIQLLLVFVVPMVLLVWHWFEEQPSPQRGAVLGATLTFSVLACAYYGIMMGLAVGFAALWFAWRRAEAKRYWIGLGTAVLVAGLTVAPIAIPYASLRAEGMRTELNVDEARSYSADHRSYMRGQSGALVQLLPASTRASIDRYVGKPVEVLFPGLVVLVLAVIGTLGGAEARALRRQENARRTSHPAHRTVFFFYAALIVLAVWASFGPRAGLYVWLADVIPFMSFLRAPARFGVLVLMGLAVFAGWGISVLARNGRRAAVVGMLLLALVVVETRVTWPLRQVPPVADAYKMLAGLPPAGTIVLHFPYRSGEWFPHVEQMFWSMWHWQPLVNGYSDYIPQDVIDLAIPVNSFPSAEAFAILKVRDVKYVVIDWRTYNEAATAVMRARFPPFAEYLRPLVTTGDVYLYEIVAWP
jgi:Dolichyl-phosphate-mannose-protein mannosyltransferase